MTLFSFIFSGTEHPGIAYLASPTTVAPMVLPSSVPGILPSFASLGMQVFDMGCADVTGDSQCDILLFGRLTSDPTVGAVAYMENEIIATNPNYFKDAVLLTLVDSTPLMWDTVFLFIHSSLLLDPVFNTVSILLNYHNALTLVHVATSPAISATPILIESSSSKDYACAAFGDVNNDTWVDVVASDRTHNAVILFTNTQNTTLPSFSSRTCLYSIPEPRFIILADLTSDNVLDILVSSWALETIVFLKGGPNGTFPIDPSGASLSPRLVAQSVTGGGSDVVLFDVNGDHRDDICFSYNGNGEGRVECRISTGDGFFSSHPIRLRSQTEVPNTEYTRLAIGHIDETTTPGALDLVAYTKDGDEIVVFHTHTPSVPSLSRPSIANPTPDGIQLSIRVVVSASVDLDTDSRPDVLLGTSGAPYVLWNDDDVDTILVDPLPVAPADDPTSFSVVTSMAALDLTRSGLFDVVFTARSPAVVAYYPHIRARVFGPAILLSPSYSPAPISLVALDIHSDGLIDLAFVVPGTSVITLLSNGGTDPTTLSFSSFSSPPPPPSSTYTRLASPPFDADFDGVVDLVVTSRLPSGSLWVFSSANVTSPPTPLVAPGGVTRPDVSFAMDVDADGILDVVTTSSPSDTNTASGSLYWARGSSSSFDPPALLISSLRVSGPVSFGGLDVTTASVLDLDADGDDDIVYRGAIYMSLLISSPSGPGAPLLTKIDINGALLSSDAIGMTHGDYNKDGIVEFYVFEYNSKMTYLYSLAYSPWIGLSTSSSIVPGSAPECGGVPNSFACLASALAMSSSCSVTRVHLESLAPIRGCGASKHIKTSPTHTNVILGPATLDCSLSPSGVLFHVPASSSLSVFGVDVHAAASTRGSVLGGSPMQVYGTFLLSNASVSHSDTSNADATLPFGGLGGFLLAVDSGTVSLVDVVFEANTAGLGGGVVALVGADASVVASRCAFVSNLAKGSRSGSTGGGVLFASGISSAASFTACRFSHNSAVGSGGVFLVADSATGASLDVEQGTFVGSKAGEAGGVLALFAVSESPSVSVHFHTRTEIESSSAVWGGTFALLPSYAVLPVTSVAASPAFLAPASSPSASAGIAGNITVAPDTVVSNSHAQYGGLVALCKGHVSFPVVPTGTASVSGPIAYACPPPGSEADARAVLHSWLATPTPLSFSDVSTPPTSLVVQSPLPQFSQSGVVFDSGSVQFLDAFENVFRDPSVVFKMAVDATAEPGLGSRVAIRGMDLGIAVAAESGGVTLARAAYLSAIDWPSILGNEVPLVGVLANGHIDTVVPPLPLASTVTGCLPKYGRISDVGAPLECRLCPDGTMSATPPDTASCLLIPACGPGAVRLATAGTNESTFESLPPCLCQLTFYAPSGEPDSPCVACPEEATCAGGVEPPLARPGFFETGKTLGGEEADYVFELCRVPSLCIGGNTCARGSSGLLCSICTKGYFTDAEGVCQSCPSNARLRAALIGIAVAIGLGVFFFVVMVQMRKRTRIDAGLTVERGGWNRGGVVEENLLQSRSPKVPLVLSIGVLFGQVVSLVGQTLYNWPSSASTVYSLFDVFTYVDTSRAGLNACVIDSWALQYSFSVLLPLFPVVVFVVVAIMLGSGVYKTLAAVAIHVGPLGYLPLSTTALLLLDCTRFSDGTYRLDSNLAIRCYEGPWLSVLPLGLGAIVLYVLGIPVFCGWLLYSARNSLFAEHLALPLYRSWRRSSYFFEVLQMVRRLGIATTILFFSHRQTAQFLTLLLLFMSSTVVFLTREPYFSTRINKLEGLLNGILSLLILMGYVLYTGTSNTERVLFGVCTIVLIASAVIALVVVGVQEWRARSDEVRRSRDVRFARFVEREVDDFCDPELMHALKELKEMVRTEDGGGVGDGVGVEMEVGLEGGSGEEGGGEEDSEESSVSW